MKILVLIDKFPPEVRGGYELRCEEACTWLYQKGYEIVVLTTSSLHPSNNHPFPVHRELRNQSGGGSIWKQICISMLDNYVFSKVIARTKPDLIYIWKSSEISRSLIPKIFQAPVPKLVDISAPWFHKVATQHGRIYRFIERNSHRPVRRVIKKGLSKILPWISFGLLPDSYRIDWDHLNGYFTSQANKNFHVERIPECHSFSVFHTGVNLVTFPFKQKTKLSDPIQLLFVGRIEKDKGFYLLLDQIKAIRSKGVLLRVVGSFRNADEKKHVESLVAQMGFEDKVVFVGQMKREELFTLYQHSDFTVFPSICAEAFSRVPLESMACGTPCISTGNPGSRELFNLNAPLVLLERTEESLADIIDNFALNQDRYEKASLEGRNFVERSFTFEHFMTNIEETFLKDWSPV